MRAHPGPAPSFLFVDADPRALAALRRLVRDLPGMKRFALGVREALQLMGEAEPSVVVSSYGLPDGDGLHLLTCVRARHPGTACALHTTHPPPTRGLEARGITWMDRAAPPQQVLELLASLG
ncbi:response regulator transcription factor [Corallococcus llansteffanensis]|uniref:DNA-binding response regulator n=1 Tax=Corallococcus llansteffanensis TaxID=2316731 RepID=A0A3A8NGQ4_9BACT|nr:response regulator transcription factor [Corallococcus llansteffanensis]RKH43458.1 DNA-binding response regulator [Corallococcus llansteffanensis]